MPRSSRRSAPITASDLRRATAAIEADRASSVRHWTEVRDHSAIRAADLTASEDWRSRAREALAIANDRLAALARGEQVSAGFGSAS